MNCFRCCKDDESRKFVNKIMVLNEEIEQHLKKIGGFKKFDFVSLDLFRCQLAGSMNTYNKYKGIIFVVDEARDESLLFYGLPNIYFREGLFELKERLV